MTLLKRTCKECHIEKDIEDFYRSGKNSKGLQKHRWVCKQCYDKYHHRRKEKRRKLMYEIKKDLCCNICGYSRETHKTFKTSALEFHHHEDNKSFSISDAFSNGYKWSRVIEEMEKCIVLCARCHAEIHSINEPN